jgi:hypothetical protein
MHADGHQVIRGGDMPGIEHHAPSTLLTLLAVLFDHTLPNQTFPPLEFAEEAAADCMFAIHSPLPIRYA